MGVRARVWGGGSGAGAGYQRRCIIFSRSTPNFLAYMRANLVSVNAQPWRPAEKATVPFVGSTIASPSASSWYVAMSTLTFSQCLTKAVYMSSDGSCSSRKARSSLLIVITGLVRGEAPAQGSAYRPTPPLRPPPCRRRVT